MINIINDNPLDIPTKPHKSVIGQPIQPYDRYKLANAIAPEHKVVTNEYLPPILDQNNPPDIQKFMLPSPVYEPSQLDIFRGNTFAWVNNTHAKEYEYPPLLEYDKKVYSARNTNFYPLKQPSNNEYPHVKLFDNEGYPLIREDFISIFNNENSMIEKIIYGIILILVIIQLYRTM